MNQENFSVSKELQGFDILIISTNTSYQESLWQKRLKELKGVVLKPDAITLAITEEWPNGAGNGLGTLYALSKAQEKAKFMYQKDLYEMQKRGSSVAIYHTAGKGKRLFPIAASEFNDKSSVKLPGSLNQRPLTILEAVIRQTSQLAGQRKGRLSVFWGDQIFIPSKKTLSEGDCHIEILGKKTSFPTAAEWEKLGLESYGTFSIAKSGETKLFEKVDYGTFYRLVTQKGQPEIKSVATSLGSFSLSPQMTFALLREFQPEIDKQKGKLESDPHFWMPLTLNLEAYQQLMEAKGESPQEIKAHYERMNAFKSKFFQLHTPKNFFKVVDLGQKSYWWDLGSIHCYYQNLLKLTSLGGEGETMRHFYNIDPLQQNLNDNCVIKDDGTCLINCNIRSGKILNSILIGVEADRLEVRNCIMINSKFTSASARYALFYNVEEKKETTFSPGTVRADVLFPKTKETLLLYSHQGRDGKIDWNHTLPQNTMSFEDVYNKIRKEFHGS